MLNKTKVMVGIVSVGFLILCSVTQLAKCQSVRSYRFSRDQLDWMESLSCKANPPPQHPSIRVEYRQLSDTERSEFHRALLRMKTNFTIQRGVSKYDTLARAHHFPDSSDLAHPGAHEGPAFLLWHREYLCRWERALQEEGMTSGIPYYWVPADRFLTDIYDSTIFSSTFMGDTRNTIVTGGFMNIWRLPRGVRVPWNRRSNRIHRVHRGGRCPNIGDVNNILRRTSFRAVVGGCDDDRGIEGIHNQCHRYIGGTMSHAQYAVYDPVFLIYHTFVDYLWEAFRLEQSPRVRQTQYTRTYCNRQGRHRLTSPMVPFRNVTNRDGLSDRYQQFYVYAQFPICSSDFRECGSDHLVCIRAGSNFRCEGRRKSGARCSVSTQCIDGRCARGRCGS